MSEAMFEFCGAKYPLDIEDFETMKIVNQTFDEAEKAQSTIPKDGSLVVQAEAQFAIVEQVFDSIFGEETRRAILGERRNLGNYIEAYAALVDHVRKSASVVNNRVSKLQAMYSPNRAQRRHPATKK